VPGSLLVLGDDVELVGRLLDITVGTSEVLRLPESWLEEVMPRLTKAGYRVALCDETVKAA